MIIYTPPKPVKEIPLIDLSGTGTLRLEDRLATAREIHIACRDTGFFYVANHGVPNEKVARVFSAAKDFFDLPLDKRMALHMKQSVASAGYEPMGAQILDSQDASQEKAPPDLKESYYSGLDLPDDHPLALKRIRNYGHNQWPQDLPDFRLAMTDYYSEMLTLGRRILSLLALSLNLPEDWFEPAFASPSANLRLIKYPPQPGKAATNQIGAGAHTDWGGITILAQDQSGGLEVRNVAGDWVEAPPIADAFVINLGDLMARWTNGVYASNMHRVKNNRSGGDRYSIPFFLSPNPESVIDALPGCIGDEMPRKFAPCTAAEHMSEMFRRSYGYEVRV